METFYVVFMGNSVLNVEIKEHAHVEVGNCRIYLGIMLVPSYFQ